MAILSSFNGQIFKEGKSNLKFFWTERCNNFYPFLLHMAKLNHLHLYISWVLWKPLSYYVSYQHKSGANFLVIFIPDDWWWKFQGLLLANNKLLIFLYIKCKIILTNLSLLHNNQAILNFWNFFQSFSRCKLLILSISRTYKDILYRNVLAPKSRNIQFQNFYCMRFIWHLIC